MCHEMIDLQSKQAALGEMLENIAHQWRQPLSVITTAASGVKMQKQYDMLEDVHLLSAMDTIGTQAQYLSQTIDDFRNFVKGTNEKELYDFKKMIDEFLHLVQGSIQSNHIKVERDTDRPIRVFGDKNRLIQGLINLYNNAKDAFKEHPEKERIICISTKTEGENAVICFRDNAGGIPEEIMGKIFEPYFTTKHKAQGTGLGLHMTHQLIVDGMGGTISVKNDQHPCRGIACTGAHFTITLPLHREEENPRENSTYQEK